MFIMSENVFIVVCHQVSLTRCILGNFSCFFCCLLIFFKINFVKKFFQEYHQNVPTVWTLIRSHDWVQTVSQGYQQTTLRVKQHVSCLLMSNKKEKRNCVLYDIMISQNFVHNCFKNGLINMSLTRLSATGC